MAVLNASPIAVPLGEGYALRAPAMRGSADLKRPRPADERQRSRAPEDGTAELDEAFDRTGLVVVREVELRVQPVSGPGTARLRSASGSDVVELQVPDLGPETGQLVLTCDETGVLTWQLPVDEGQRVETPRTRGAGGVKRFLIPATTPQPAPDAEARDRSLIGVVGRKLLKVLVYPVTDPIVGAIGDAFAERWETRHRPYQVRDFSPANAHASDVAPLSEQDWTRLRAGRALLLIHGTFSTAHAAFALLPPASLSALHQRYGGRVFAFNHFTLSHDPARNVQWLLDAMPDGPPLEVDILCHSRGGLVARTLAERPSPFDLDTSRVSVKRIVFAGVPNQGTLLADPTHMVEMIDRLTTALNLFPSGAVAETLEAIITAVKVIGHGALNSLDGLASMRPGGPFLAKLNTGTPRAVEYYGIAADFEPAHSGLHALLAGVANGVADRVFESAGNDLVVPEEGVYTSNGCGAFPIDAGRLLRLPRSAAVCHTTMFSDRSVGGKITQWLQG